MNWSDFFIGFGVGAAIMGILHIIQITIDRNETLRRIKKVEKGLLQQIKNVKYP